MTGLRHRRSSRAAAFAVCAFAALVLAQSAHANGVPLAPGEVLADVGQGQIRHFSNTGTLLDTLDTTTGTSEGDGMCLDSAKNLYATQGFSAGTVSKFDMNGNLVAANFGSGYDGHPESCIVDAAGNVYVGQPDGSHQVLKFDGTGKLLATFAPAIENRGTDWIDLAADQCTLHYTSEGSSIKQFNVCTNTQLPDFATSLPGGGCFGHRILADGGELVACRSQVDRLDATGKLIQTYLLPGASFLFAINIDPDGTTFWTADYVTGKIFRVDIATGNVVTTFTSAPNTVMGGLAIVGELTAAADPKIVAAGSAVSATEGKPFTGTVATFTDPETKATASEYSATVTWGDGSTSTGTISGSGGSFTVTGTHTYAEEGQSTPKVTITDTDNTANASTASSTVTVADAALSAKGSTKLAEKKGKFNGTVATFTDADPGGTKSDYTARISWGDGSTTSGTVTGLGTFFVGGSHHYRKSGTFHIKITIKDQGGSTATATATIVVPVPSRARLSGVPSACTLGSFTATVSGKRISRVTFRLDGSKITGSTVHRGTLYRARVAQRPGKHHLTVRVTFVKSAQTRARTFTRTVSGCVAKPRFTG